MSTATTPCDRCGAKPATTHQEWRNFGDQEHWPNNSSDRCDDCAEALRDYARVLNRRALPDGALSLDIVVDEALASAGSRSAA